MAEASASVQAPPIPMSEFVVEILLARFIAPVALNPPAAVIAPVELFVKVPLLETLIAPVEVRELVTLKAVPLKDAEPTETAALNVVVPVAALVCVKAPVIFTAPPNVIAALLVTVRFVRLVEDPEPTAARLIAPPAAFRVKLSPDPLVVPSIRPETVIPPDPAVNVTEAASAIVKVLPI
jgi:hypothetical protein